MVLLHSRSAGLALLVLALTLLLLCPGSTPAAPVDLKSDTWAAVDGAGRTLPGYEEAGPPRPGKKVGLLYFLWHGAHGTQGPFDITELLAADPDNPAWGPLSAPHHWGRPELGYYLSTDEYVIRRHAQMLSDAGVDVIIFDVTNGFTYAEQYQTLLRVFSQVRAEGGQTPQVAFLAPFYPPRAHTVTKKLFADLYGPGLYPELWFIWDGKPLLLADPEIFWTQFKEFFAFRSPQPSYFTGPTGPDQWGWLEVWPQNGFYDSSGNLEQVTVGVAQNAFEEYLVPMSYPRGAKGRSWLGGLGSKVDEPGAVELGYNFAEQWQRALDLDPEFIFITGFNEWVAARTNEWTGPAGYTDPRGGIFIDAYTQEYSRDIEPMAGGHGDNYYFQMAAQIRRFKGVRSPEPASPARSMVIDGDFSDWEEVGPEYLDTPGDVAPRDHPGWGSAGPYLEASGRNDLVAAKVARDSRFVYFYARTAAPLTDPSGPNWMLLFIDVDQDHATGWEGYDFAVNLEVLSSGRTTLKRSDGQGGWMKVRDDIPFRVAGAELELAVPRSSLGLGGGDPAFDFHWADNLGRLGDITQFALSGDSAPNRRFNYRYQAP